MTDPAWLIPTKIGAPQPPAGWLRRGRLVAAVGDRSCAMVAGPGWGKSLALRALYDRARERGWLALWYTADASDGDVGTFYRHLAHAGETQIPGLAAALEPALDGRSGPQAFWLRLGEAVRGYAVPGVAVFIDEFHWIAEAMPEAARGILAAQELGRGGLITALAMRRRCGLRFRPEGAYHVLGPAELAFADPEAEAFLILRAAPASVPAGWRERAAAVEGWPLGLALVATRADGAALVAERADDRLVRYVAEELVGAQPPARQAFMVAAAILEAITAAACQAVFGDDQARTHLEALAAEGLIQRLEHGAGYRFPAYLREYLLAEAALDLSPGELAARHRRAASFFQAAGREEQAIPHWMAAGEWSAARASCDACFPAMIARGRFGAVARSLAGFPEAIAATWPSLVMWRGTLAFHDGRTDEAGTAFARAGALFLAGGDAAGHLKAVVRSLNLALYRRDWAAAETLMAQALAALPAGHDEDRADVWLAQAFAAEQRGDMAGMRAANLAVLGLPSDANVEVGTCRCLALMNMTTLALHTGDLVGAHGWLDDAAETASRWQLEPFVLYVRFLRLNLAVVGNDLVAAGELARALPAAWPERLDWIHRGCAYVILGRFHLARGDWADADASLDRAHGTFLRAGFEEGRRVALEPQLWLAIARGHYHRALGLLREATGEGEARAASLYELALELPRARALTLTGDPHAACAVLDEALGGLERLGAKVHLAHGQLLRAAALLRRGSPDAARRTFDAAERAIEDGGLGFLRRQDAMLWRELAPLTSAWVPGDPVAPRLELRLFGAFEARLDGLVIRTWPRRRARAILAALALRPEGYAAEALAIAVGVTPLTPAALKGLQIDIGTLRRILEPGLAAGRASGFVRQAGGSYRLEPRLVAASDVWGFDEAFRRWRSKAGGVADARAALALYAGPLLADGPAVPAAEPLRDAYRRKAADVAIWLATTLDAQNAHQEAERVLARAIALDPARETLAIATMRHHAALGRAARVQEAYWDFRKALKAVTGGRPSDEAEALRRGMMTILGPP